MGYFWRFRWTRSSRDDEQWVAGRLRISVVDQLLERSWLKKIERARCRETMRNAIPKQSTNYRCYIVESISCPSASRKVYNLDLWEKRQILIIQVTFFSLTVEIVWDIQESSYASFSTTFQLIDLQYHSFNPQPRYHLPQRCHPASINTIIFRVINGSIVTTVRSTSIPAVVSYIFLANTLSNPQLTSISTALQLAWSSSISTNWQDNPPVS